jgi:hypothetical protein
MLFINADSDMQNLASGRIHDPIHSQLALRRGDPNGSQFGAGHGQEM